MEEKKGSKKRKYKKLLSILIILLVVLILISVYYFFLREEDCEDTDCFSDSLLNCKRARFIQNDITSQWEYRILGEKDKMCEINVKLLSIKKGNIDLSSAEGKDMLCLIQKNLVLRPEKQIENCHGILKEELQKIVINRMHAYIYENLGEIATSSLEVF